MTDIITLVNTSYKKTYINSYGMDIVISIITFTIFVIAIMYYYVKSNIPGIKQNWPNLRCNPLYMPFAGFVANNSNKSSFQLINDNFSQCIHNILSTISQDALAPIHYVNKVNMDSISESLNATTNMRALLDKMRNNLTNTTETIMGRALNVMMPPLHMAITTKDALSRVKGLYTSGIYFLIGNYIIIQSLMKNILHIIVTVILVSLVATIIGLMFIPFIGQGLAAPLIAIMIGVSIPTVLMIGKINSIFGMDISADLPHL